MYDLESEIQQVTEAKHGLHIPIIMPDEFYEGYRGWVTAVNGLTSTSDTNKILSNWVKQSHAGIDIKRVPAAYSLAKLLNMDVETFIRQHTLAPITAAIKSKSAPSNADATAQQNLNLQGMLTLTSKKIKKAACFCVSCIEEDLDYLGYSFWRRSHQLSGIDWCSKHNIPLCEVTEDDPYAIQPAIHLWNKSFIEISIKDHASHPVISRYAQLIQDALELTVPLDFKVTSQVLLKKSKKFNVRINVIGNKKTLSDVMIEQLPADWLSKHFPKLKKEKPGTYLYTFDDLQRQNSDSKSCMNTLLAAAVLFESADEAILEFTQHHYKPSTTLKPKDVDDKTIIKTYIKYQGNIRKIASELDQNYQTALNITSRLGLPALTNLDKVTFNAIVSFYNGESLLTVMNNPDINLEKFQSVMRTAGTHFSSTMNKFKPSISSTKSI